MLAHSALTQLAMLLLPFLFPSLCAALDSSSMRARSVYQVVTDRFALPDSNSTTAINSGCSTAQMEYCGGSWSGIESRLSYIQGMGFDTIWISPIVENIGGTTGEGQAYHGYWTLNPAELNGNFGTADDLKSLVSAAHAKGMYIMVDVVINHVAATSSSTFAPSSDYGPFASSDDYHPFCWITDYSNQTNVEYCWLGDSDVALPDLNTESSTVTDYWTTWIANLTSTYSFDAVRIDTVKHIPMTFWPTFVSSAGVANVGEVLDGSVDYVAPYQSEGQVNPFNYPTYYPLIEAFNTTSGNLSALAAMIRSVQSSFSDVSLLGTFLDNHDNPRFASYTSDSSLRINAQTFPLIGDGVPYVYYGSEANLTGGADPANREALWQTGFDTTGVMYTLFRNLNAARTAAASANSDFYSTKANVSQLSDTTLLVAKAGLFSVFTNAGEGSSESATLPSSTTGWSAGTAVIDAVGCANYTTDSSGNLQVTLSSGLPKVLIASSSKGNVCAAANTTSSTSSSSSGAPVRFAVGDSVAAATAGAILLAGAALIL